MAKYRYLQHIDSHIEVEIEAESMVEAEEKGITEVMNMADEEYNRQLIANAEAGEGMIDEIT